MSRGCTVLRILLHLDILLVPVPRDKSAFSFHRSAFETNNQQKLFSSGLQSSFAPRIVSHLAPFSMHRPMLIGSTDRAPYA